MKYRLNVSNGLGKDDQKKTFQFGLRFNFFLYLNKKTKDPLKIRGREPGRSPRAEGECMSADECKQHDCDHSVIARSFKSAHAHKIHTKLMHIEVFCNLLQSYAIIFLISFETLISNMRYIWLNCKC